jgi:hypothetical protein
MLDRIACNGIRCIIVESPDRFARDLTVQLTGHDFLKSLGISLAPATAPVGPELRVCHCQPPMKFHNAAALRLVDGVVR